MAQESLGNGGGDQQPLVQQVDLRFGRFVPDGEAGQLDQQLVKGQQDGSAHDVERGVNDGNAGLIDRGIQNGEVDDQADSVE